MAGNAIQYLIDFAEEKNCSSWLRSVICSFLQEAGKVSDATKERLTEELLSGESGTVEFDSTNSKTIKSERIDFVSFQHISGVNALAANQTIRFGKDINIIYGLNGTGKSSYFRAINSIIGTDHSATIRGNIYLDKVDNPQAKLLYKVNGNKEEYLWENTGNSPSELSTVRVFDTSYTAGLLKKRSSDELLAKPFRLSVFSELISLIEELSQLAEEKVNAEEEALPTIDITKFSEEIRQIFNQEQLSEDDIKKVKERAIYDDASAKRVDEIQNEIKQLQQINIDDKIKLETEHKDKVSVLQNQIIELYESIKGYEEKVSQAIGLLKQRKAESEDSRLKFENLRSIPGIESDSWKRFVTAGKEYSEENDLDVCPYCHRPYDTKALELVAAYSAFLADENETNYRSQLDAVKSLRYQVDHIRILTEQEYQLEFLSKSCQNEAALFIQRASIIKNKLLKGIDDSEFQTDSLQPIDTLLDRLKDYISTAEECIKGLNTDAGEKTKKIKKLSDELEILLEKKSVFDQYQVIEHVIDGKNNIFRKRKLLSGISTNKLSNLSRRAHDELLTKRLESLFGEILRSLNIKDVSIQLKSQNNKGVQQTELMIKGIKTVDDILSEGEQKATALALFLAEIIMSENHSTLVFDDPVNSMDHRMMGSFAEKLLQLDNQIIIFTHNRMFLESFGESLNGHFCKTYDSDCSKNKGRHILLYETLSEGKNSKGVISRKQIEKAENMINQVEVLLKESPFTKKQEACAKLRFAVELLVDEVVFNGQVPTKYSTKSSRINWDGLKSITNNNTVIDTLKAVHGRCSGGELHNGLERNENPVEKEDIQEMVNSLKAIKNR